jgi:hypothetical protein
VITEVSVSNVASSSATFQAQVDPEGAETTYSFEYGTTSSYGASVPVPAGDAGSGTSAVTVRAHLQGLQPGTMYHFRGVASSGSGVAHGSDQTFTTQVGGGELVLPDGRRWELVSPPTKTGGGIEPIGFSALQAAEDGSAITYVTNGPIVANPPGNTLIDSQVLSRRDAGGWSSQDISPPHGAVAPYASGGQYMLFSSDLSLGLVDPIGETPLAPGASGPTTYLRNDVAGSYQAVAKSAQFIYASPDLSHLVLRTGEGLAEWSGGQSQLVGVLPDGTSTTCAGLGGHDTEIMRSVSNSGSRIVWGNRCGAEGLYLRDIAKGESIQLDASQGGEPTSGERAVGEYQTASSDGSRVFFTDAERLTATATAKNAPDLYECEIVEAGGRLACDLRDLTIDGNAGESAAVQGTVLGASEDGSYLYYVAKGALAAGAHPGAYNLYAWHNGVTTFVGSLSAEDMSWADLSFFGNLAQLTARVSPNGRYLAFMSNQSLTGYDNRDASSGVPDEEVFLYDASTGRLTCASCNPTGARPEGVFDSGENREGTSMLVDRGGIVGGKWLAASIPGWSGFNLSLALYQSRYLSDEGRLFFDSTDALVPQDTNGLEDVYEYEPTGVGGCVSSSTGFETGAGGCVALISSGASSEESAFLDASGTGADVFFLTSGRLAPQDYDTSLDVYDAHVCSEATPCSAAPVAPPACTTADSCRAALSPQPAVFGAPPSATFSGTGNLAQPTSVTVVKQKKRKAKSKKARSRKRRGRSGKAGKRGRQGRRQAQKSNAKHSVSFGTGR